MTELKKEKMDMRSIDRNPASLTRMLIATALALTLAGCHTCHAPEHICPTLPDYEHPAYGKTLIVDHFYKDTKLPRGDSCGWSNCPTCQGEPFCKGLGKQADWKIKSDKEHEARMKAFKGRPQR